MDRMNRTAGCAEAPKRDNSTSRLNSATECSKTNADEIANVTNLIRETLIGKPPSVDPMTKATLVREAPAGLFGSLTLRVEETNRMLSYVLDELRIVLGEIQ